MEAASQLYAGINHIASEQLQLLGFISVAFVKTVGLSRLSQLGRNGEYTGLKSYAH